MSHPKIIFVAGPTASGKSALALDLAHKSPATIINADALQVYQGLPILTAQPTADQQKEIPHELYGTVSPREHSSAGTWLEEAKDAIQNAIAAKRTPILVGGTGLYFKALLGGLAEIPDVPKNVRATVEQLYDALGEEKFRSELKKRDPESAMRLARNDRQRSIRAYEVVLHTGKTLGHWYKRASGRGLGKEKIESHLLLPPRHELYTACDRRFKKMMELGAVDEADKFLKRNLAPTLPATKTIGLRELGAYLRDEITLDEAVTKAQQMTRNYAKRQMTWFKNQWPFKNE